MTRNTLSQSPAHAGPSWESLLVLGSVTLLSGLAVADRLTTWLIGQYPTYAPLWRLRFEFLRPIGVYYDMVERNFGDVSPANFSTLALAMAALIAAGIVSRIRLARALSCHLTLGIAAVLGVMSWDPGFTLRPHAVVGMASQPYAALGLALAAVAAGLCLRIHAEYTGWNAASSRSYRRARIAAIRLRSNLSAYVADIIDQVVPAPGRMRAALAAVRANRDRNSRQ
ncbi:MAG TPA: hypothetical protein VFZ03_07525 [Dongiaceae bacterium]